MNLKTYYNNYLATTQLSSTVTIESAFKAGYLAGLERAAVECDSEAAKYGERGWVWETDTSNCAESIRSLKENV